MKLIIDIPKDIIESAKSSPNYYPTYHFEKIWKAIVNGIPLPKGHGRIGDLDALRCENADFDTYNDYCTMFDEIEAADTIIEADMESEDEA